MIVLGIESSCDETAAAVYTTEGGLRSNVVASQKIHTRFGGVVPELASRAHQQTIWGTVSQALAEAGLQAEDVDVVAVTQGPGLMGALLVGLCFAKGFVLANGKRLVGVNHMDAHMYANFIDNPPVYPFLCLTVSGGHTQLTYVKEPFAHTLLGKTRDDAAGEAFDKIGKILGLPYPAGPVMDKHAQRGNPGFHKFPQGLLGEGFDFSFSGLKTSVLYYLQKQGDETAQAAFLKDHLQDVCASVSHAITEVLMKKLEAAMQETGCRTLMLAGGVSANTMLREKARQLAQRSGATLLIPKMAYCTDNAAMIAVTGHMLAQRGNFSDLSMKPFARVNG
ncbi:O-sialoglycoprotein endopeptidase [Cyclonatronum proteinivorum]|uniref:tRNA N6-adenosine threonylcarbamoyltransferase n=1 Tax=Cyclonatronum proteinivorum TaxID=1457365 RepID=A0A345UPG6_9BACT|nr:tRNA (adenosine(37)-N6)-threonylcarbamoyltransferase complex transferase subunit TsaD [Cyclonatronum proteinivorum]AXJ02368.1 O-sialoglycoprotein endopeptidase [Cyclonatronum proteinivorum]